MSAHWFYLLIGWLVGSFFGLGAVITFGKGLFAKPAMQTAAS